MTLKKVSAVLLSVAFFGGHHTAMASDSWSGLKNPWELKNPHGANDQDLEAAKERLKPIDKSHLSPETVQIPLHDRQWSARVCKTATDITAAHPPRPYVQLLGKVIYSRNQWLFRAVIGHDHKWLPIVFSFPMSKELGMLTLPGGKPIDQFDDAKVFILNRTQPGHFVYAWVDAGRGDFHGAGYVQCLSLETTINSSLTPITPDDMAALEPGEPRKYVPPRRGY